MPAASYLAGGPSPSSYTQPFDQTEMLRRIDLQQNLLLKWIQGTAALVIVLLVTFLVLVF
jgi:hypothetical protein